MSKRTKRIGTKVDAVIVSKFPETGGGAFGAARHAALGSKSWLRAVEKYAGDEDLLAVLAEAKKLRDAERKKARRRRPRRSSS